MPVNIINMFLLIRKKKKTNNDNITKCITKGRQRIESNDIIYIYTYAVC